MSEPTPRVAYFWGEDAFGIGQAVRDLASDLAASGEAMTTWRADADEESAEGVDGGAGASTRRRTRTLDEIEERLSTAPLFGGGTLVGGTN